MALTIALVVTLWVGYLIYKKYKPQPVLVVGGFILMYIAVIMGYGKIVAPKASTGALLFDTFQFMSMTLSSRAAKLGLNIMCVGAFAKYMDAIGASRALVRMTIKPLLKLRSPYLVLALSWVLGLVIGLCINSASGLAMLLMVTVFPILVGLGVSRLAATAAVASTLCFDWSPSDTGTILSAETAGLDPVIYWTDYQVPIVIVAFFVVSALFYFSQKYLDKKAGHVVKPVDVDAQEASDDPRDHAPAIYALLPVVPLALILCFSPLWITWIKVNIINAMMIGLAIGMIAEYIRSRNLKEVFAGVQAFFDGMGLQMANVVTLIVAGQVFAQGLMSMGVIDHEHGRHRHPDQEQPGGRLQPHADDDRHGRHHRRVFRRHGFRQCPVLRLRRAHPGSGTGQRHRTGALPAAHAFRGLHRPYVLPDYGRHRRIERHGQRIAL